MYSKRVNSNILGRTEKGAASRSESHKNLRYSGTLYPKMKHGCISYLSHVRCYIVE